MNASLAFLAPALPTCAFFVIVLFGRWLPRGGAPVAIAATAGAFVVFVITLLGMLSDGASAHSIRWFEVQGQATFTWGTVIDPLSVVMLGLVAFVALLIQVYSWSYMREERRFGWYFAVHSLFAAAMMALVLADNLILMYLAWELVGLGSYLLIGYWWEKRSAAEAAKKAFVTTRIGDVGLLIGIILLFKATGTFSISGVISAVETSQVTQPTLNWSLILIFLGAMGKSAQVPLHVWLPDAMEGPTPVSALIHAATMVAAGVYLVARLFPIFDAGSGILPMIAVVGLLTALVGAAMALVQTDLKRVLAYSTVSHLGFMMLALGAGSVGAAMFHLLAHAFAKAALFLGAGAFTHSTHQTDIRRMTGLLRGMRLTSIAFIASALSLAGIPPLAGFFSKDEILLAILDGHLGVVFLVFALIAVVLSALYTGRLLFVLFSSRPFVPEGDKAARGREGGAKAHAEPTPGESHAVPHEAPLLLLLPILILAVLGAVAGLLAFGWTGSYSGFGAYITLGHDKGFHIEPWLTALAFLLVAVALLQTWRSYISQSDPLRSATAFLAPARRLLERKLYFDTVYQWIVDRVVVTAAQVVGLVDRAVVNDKGIEGQGILVRYAGAAMRYLQTGMVYNYALGLALGAFFVAVVWWILS